MDKREEVEKTLSELREYYFATLGNPTEEIFACTMPTKFVRSLLTVLQGLSTSRELEDCICDWNPDTTDGPQEDCPQHGRRYSEVWEFLYKEIETKRALLNRVEGSPVTGSTSDGYHTFDELYEYRLLYNAALFNSWFKSGEVSVAKSWRHSDGEEIFDGHWFIVVATLPGIGQISNHYPEKDWDLFDIPVVRKAPEYDGHTPQDAAYRLRKYIEGTTPPSEHMLEF